MDLQKVSVLIAAGAIIFWSVVSFLMVRHFNRRAETAKREALRLQRLVEKKEAEILHNMPDDEPDN